MKIIHFTGHSNSGKTTTIHQLLDELTKKYPGKVAVIKHMGHHTFELAPGKDTTTHFEHNAYAVAGIDSSKTITAAHTDNFNEILDAFADAGMKITIIEGFKDIGFKKVVLGDLEIENSILRNPSIEDIIKNLDNFDDYYTMKSIVLDLKSEIDTSKVGAFIAFNGIVRENTDGNHTEYLEFNNPAEINKLLRELEEKAMKTKGIVGAKFYHTIGRIYAGGDLTYFALAAEHRQEAFRVMSDTIDELKKRLHDVGKELSD